MNLIYFILPVVAVFLIVGAIVGLVFSRRNRVDRFRGQFGPEYDRTVQALGGNQKAQQELKSRQQHVKSLTIRSLSRGERERYLADWKTVQAKFVDLPGQATTEADRLIMEVMQKRDYPVSDFEERAADISVNYPTLVSNYRAARQIAIKNEHHKAGTEELRQAVLYYRSLFEELLKSEKVAPAKA